MKWLSDSALDRLRAAADAPDLSGTRYVLVDKLGQGGMGSVYRVQDTMLGRLVALKVVGFADSSCELAARLLREAKVIAQLEHPGIVPVHDVGTLPDGRVFYTMKLVQGQRLDQRETEVGSVLDRLRMFQKICEAVSFAHAHRVLHRDLKPQNVMVGPFGEVLVMDWGLSKLLNSGVRGVGVDEPPHPSPGPAVQAPPVSTAHGAVLGTPGYMAPEQARGDLVVQRCDQPAGRTAACGSSADRHRRPAGHLRLPPGLDLSARPRHVMATAGTADRARRCDGHAMRRRR